MTNNYISLLNPMLTGKAVRDTMFFCPDYEPAIRNAETAVRLTGLNDLYNIFFPFPMSGEIYAKLYQALFRSLSKKSEKAAVKQLYQNLRFSSESNGIIGGSDSFTILGKSGIGKSTAIARSLALLANTEVVENDRPFCKIMPAAVVQCPYDSSVKGLLYEILRTVDTALASKYLNCALRARATTDMLIGSVATVCLNHIGLLIVDEIQNIVGNKNGAALIRCLTQLINNSGISIVMVGTPECTAFFEQDFKLARRSIGLYYDEMPFDKYFIDFCHCIWNFQYVKEPSELSDGLVNWLYQHSGGITSNVISLLHDAQEIAILDGRESVSLDVLSDAYCQRLGLLHHFINQSSAKRIKTKTEKQDVPATPEEPSCEPETGMIAHICDESKQRSVELITLLKRHMTVEEVSI